MLKVGLLGFGFMGATHCRVYENLQDVRVAGIFDIDKEKVMRGGGDGGNIDGGEGELDLSGVTVAEEAERIIHDDDIDIIDICLPTFLHADFTEKALKAGKNVLCEKPMALSPSECDRMLEAREDAGGKLMIGQCVRFWPEYAYAGRIIKEKKYGEVVSAFFRRLSPAPTWSYENWILNEKKSGGALLDLHIHDIDYIVDVFGGVSEVNAVGKNNVMSAGSGVDYVIAQYATGSSAFVVAEGGWHFHAGFPFNMSFHIRCENATLEFDSGRENTLSIYTEDGKTEHPPFSAATGWDEEIKYFVSCVAENKNVELSPPEDSAKAVEIALMERESVRRNAPVRI